MWGYRIFEAIAFGCNGRRNVLCLVDGTRMCYLLVLERQLGKRRDNVQETAECYDIT